MLRVQVSRASTATPLGQPVPSLLHMAFGAQPHVLTLTTCYTCHQMVWGKRVPRNTASATPVFFCPLQPYSSIASATFSCVYLWSISMNISWLSEWIRGCLPSLLKVPHESLCLPPPAPEPLGAWHKVCVSGPVAWHWLHTLFLADGTSLCLFQLQFPLM